MNVEQFIEELARKNIVLTEEQIEQFALYYELLIEWNKKMDLTAITEKKDVYLKHFYDSMTPSFHYNFERSLLICDVGAGAGFPSIPLKICFPQLKVTIVDSLKKRITFLENLIERLQLKNVEAVHARAEDFGKSRRNRESFDLVLARAVARTSVLAELCLPLNKINGMFIALKGPHIDQELQEGKGAIERLGGRVTDKVSLQLPIEKSDRTIVFIKKIKSTPRRFPRKAGIPQKNPLS